MKETTTPTPPVRDVTFTVVDGYLVRTVTGPSRYTNRCTKQAFETVAHAVNESRMLGGVSLPSIVRDKRLPHTQVNVALAFLNERSVIELKGRRWHPATEDAYLDAMCEFFVLDQKTKEG